MTSKKPPKVIIVFRRGGTLTTICYNSGHGAIRVYYKDHYDGRVDLGAGETAPFFDDHELAIAFLRKYPDRKIQLEVRAAKNIFPDSKYEYAGVL